MRNILQLFFLLAITFMMSCTEEAAQPKPAAQLALEYESAKYAHFSIEDCPYQFEINTKARKLKPKVAKPCWVNLYYPPQKATLYITYSAIDENLENYLRDAQKLPLQHTIKADNIQSTSFENKENKTYGSFYEVGGDAASQAQFYLTDSIDHFVTGSIYFEATPNYDSILPAAAYLKKDIQHLMETFQWK